MNKDYDKYIHDKTARGIDDLIIQSVSKSRKRKRVHTLYNSAFTLIILLLGFMVTLNSSGAVQAFVLNNKILAPIVQPFIINNIFEEVDTTTFEDDVIKFELVLNNFKMATVERIDESFGNSSEGLNPVSRDVTSESSKYFYDFDPDFIGITERYKSLYKMEDGIISKIHDFRGTNFQKPIYAFNNTVYYTDTNSDDVYELEHLYAYRDGKETKLIDNTDNRTLHSFLTSNNTPFALYTNNLSSQDGVSFTSINLITLEETEREFGIHPANLHGSQLDIFSDTSFLGYLNDSNDFILGTMYENNYKELSGYNYMKYTLINDHIIYGQTFRDETTKDNTHRYHVINLNNNNEYLGNETTEVFNMLSSEGIMVTVMKIESTKENNVDVLFSGMSSDLAFNKSISNTPSEIVLIGNEKGLIMNIRSGLDNMHYKYLITFDTQD